MSFNVNNVVLIVCPKSTFDIGGKNKGKKQIETAEDGYVVKDLIKYFSGNILPLWWFGLNYWNHAEGRKKTAFSTNPLINRQFED